MISPRWMALAVLFLLPTNPAAAESASGLLDDATLRAFATEISGANAKRQLEYLARLHRMRASAGFREAAEFLAAELEKAGLEQVELNEFPADGEIFYGSQRSRPEWLVRGGRIRRIGRAEGRHRFAGGSRTVPPLSSGGRSGAAGPESIARDQSSPWTRRLSRSK